MQKHTFLLLIPATLLLLGAACEKETALKTPASQGTPFVNDTYVGTSGTNTAEEATVIQWQNTGDGNWIPSSTPPACPTPLFATSPVDVSKATGILYPGQTRGGNYKPHGGFRFDTILDNVVAVTLPIDAQVVRGARYLVNGEVQYTFDFITDCGYMIRLGHLRELSSLFQQIADTFPAAQEGDSHTTFIDPSIRVPAGTVIATKIGITKDSNTFVDFGVYNLLAKNTASQNTTWASDPMHDAELAQHAVCWFDLLNATDAARVKSLPAGDPESGKKSDYCTPL